ncbi:MAG: serine/threonine-protein kinase [Myxococcota bacterium]
MSTTEPAPVVAGRYQLERDLGPSSVGRAFLARDLQSDAKPVHLRLVNDETGGDAIALARLGREIATSFLVVHPNTVEVIDSGERGTEAFLVSEHLDAATLREVLRVEGPLAPDRVRRIGLQVASALAAAHQEGIVHRGLAPETVLRLRNAEGDSVKVRDFGLAKIDDGRDVTRTGVRVGHVPYLPPEYVDEGVFTPKGDTYALGCLLSELLVGERGATSRTTIVQRVPHAPMDLLELLDGLLAPDPQDRPGIHAVIQRLQATDESVDSNAVEPDEATGRIPGALVLVMGVSLFGFVLVLALVTVALVLSLPV